MFKAFPGIEEYFMYTPQGSTTPYTTAGGNAKGIKINKRFNYILHIRTCR